MARVNIVFFIFSIFVVSISVYMRLKTQDFDKNNAEFLMPNHTDSIESSNAPPPKIIPNIEPSAHASAIVKVENALMVLFYAGEREGASDVKIYQSFLKLDSIESKKDTSQRLRAIESSAWSTPKAILTKEDLQNLTGKYFRKLGNPIVFKDKKNKIHCFIVAVSLGGWATSKIYQFYFDENLHLKFEKELHLSPFGNMSHLVRTPALPLQNGGFMLPLTYEMWIKYPLVAFFDSNGILKFVKKINNLKRHLQPSIVPLSERSCLAFFRSYNFMLNPPALTQTCNNLANTWQNVESSNLTNHDSSSLLLTFKTAKAQEILLLHNNKTRKNLTLYYLQNAKEIIESSKDSKSISPHFRELKIIDFIDTKKGEVSYPAAIIDDNFLHITYTYNRTHIAYTRLNLSKLTTLIAKDSKGKENE